ncbi:MAG: glycoside hydrolase 100 family protein, partial [Nanoarchaeota archaeon]
MIASLGASLVGEKFKKTFRESLLLLGNHQSGNGQVPNAVDIFSKRKGHVDFKSIDSTLWFIIGNYLYAKRYKDKSLLQKHRGNIEKGFAWLRCQDWSETGLLAQHPTSDWQDAFPHRYGHTINTQALYFYALALARKENKKLQKAVNEDREDCLWEGNYYYSYRWKNHNKYKEIGDWFDSLGNLLAIVFGLADSKRANKILDYIGKKKINKPFPVKAMWPAIKRGGKYWHDYFLDCDVRNPYSYLNGGIWTFIGGFYVLALIKQKRWKEAERQLERLAEANATLDWNFSEWLHGKTGKASDGGNQAWNAGMYILAYESLRKKRVLLP